MKISLALTGFALAMAAIALAQEANPNRIVIPARNTTRPRVVNVTTTHGPITVKAYNGKEVIVETSGRPSRVQQRRDGLRRIDLPLRGLTIEEEDNVVQIRDASSHDGNLIVTVPVDTSLNLHSSNGEITAEGVHGDVEAKSSNGEIRLMGISGTVVASSTNGEIKVVMDRVDPGKPLSFSSNNGDVDVTLPADFKGTVKLRSLHGSVWSDFDIKLTAGQPITTPNTTSEGRFRVQFDRPVLGTINGGGTEATFTTLNGSILIRKK